MKRLHSLWIGLLTCLFCLGFAIPAWAFCGFYVAKADTSLYNQASQVVIARSGNRTVLTMANDYQGEAQDFAMVVPVPVVLQPEQVQVAEPGVIERLDAFSAPRLVEYFDPDPCAPEFALRQMPSAAAPAAESLDAARGRNQALGVTVESRFSVGEYDILILSARESRGLANWLTQNGYRLPQGASQLLQPYIRQNLKFFVAKVNLKEYEASGYQALRPLQIRYESPRFMLPIRLGMMNAQPNQAHPTQDLIVYILSPEGQAEVANYRTVKIPSDTELPLFVQEDFGEFYQAMFSKSYEREGRNVAFLEYAWDMAGCDPCSADPLTPDELRQAGVFWLTDPASRPDSFQPWSQPSVFLSRLHVRYSRDRFPEDLMFQQTSNRSFFQGRYILRHPFEGGTITCAAGHQYRRNLAQRFEQEAQTLARLTGWKIQEIRSKLPQLPRVEVLPWRQGQPFWQRLWMALWGG
ncbi:MAG: DUF2330 domain-containing protein [Elainella sp.]